MLQGSVHGLTVCYTVKLGKFPVIYATRSLLSLKQLDPFDKRSKAGVKQWTKLYTELKTCILSSLWLLHRSSLANPTS